MYIGYYELECYVDWSCTLKERRQFSYKLRDRIKNHYNASVKLVFGEHNSHFTIYLLALGESEAYLSQLHFSLENLLETELGLRSNIHFETEKW